MKAYGLLPMMLPGTCIKFTVFEAAVHPHFVQEISRGMRTYPKMVKQWGLTIFRYPKMVDKHGF